MKIKLNAAPVLVSLAIGLMAWSGCNGPEAPRGSTSRQADAAPVSQASSGLLPKGSPTGSPAPAAVNAAPKTSASTTSVVSAGSGTAVASAQSVPGKPMQSPAPAVAMAVFNVKPKDIPGREFAGIFQDKPPQPIWTIKHQSPLGQPVISPDGRWLAISNVYGNEGKSLVLADLVKRTATDHQVAAPGVVSQAVFSRDGSELLAVVNTPKGYAFARWSVPSMTLTVKPLAAGAAIAAALTNAQDQAVVMRADGIIGVFDLASGTKRFDVNFQQGVANIYSVSIAVSPDDKFVSSGVIHPGNEYVRWSLADGARVETTPVKEHLAWGRPAAATRDGKTIFVAAHHEMYAVNAETGERRATYPGNGLNTLHYQPNVDLASAAVGNSQTFAVIEGATGQQRFWVKHAVSPPAQSPYVGWAAVAPDGKTAYSADYTSIKAWDLSVINERGPDWLTIGTTPRTLLPSRDGSSLIAVGETIDTWDLRTRRLKSTQPSWALRGDRAGDREEWRTGGGTVGAWRSGDALHAVRLDEDGAQVYDVSANKPVLRLGIAASDFLSLSKESTVPTQAIWHSASSRAIARPEVFPYLEGYLQATASPDARMLVVTTYGSSNPSCTLWSLENGCRIAVLADSSIIAQTARFSPDGKRVIVAGPRGELAIFHLTENASPRLELVGPKDPRINIIDAACELAMPTEDRIYLGTSNGYLQSWQRGPAGWNLRFEHRITDANTSYEFPAPVRRFAVTPSGRTIAAALSNDNEIGSILIIDAQTGAIRARLAESASDVYFMDEHTLVTTGIRIWTIE